MEDVFRECRVKWCDTSFYQGWQSQLELEDLLAKPPIEMESVGWLIHQDERFVMLAVSVSRRTVGDVLKIPRSAVIEMHVFNSDKGEIVNG